jgi:excisionase family DNA binding protein
MEPSQVMGAARATSLDTGKAAPQRQPAAAGARTFRVVSVETATVPRIAMSKQEAARALGVSIDFFDEHIVRDLRMVRVGRRRLVPIAELERWLDTHADLAGIP